MSAKLISVLLLVCSIQCTRGFIPNRFFAIGANLADSSDNNDDFTTHQDMTRSAILDVAADVLLDNPNPAREGSSARIAALSSLDEESLVTAYYGERQESIVSSFQDAIEEISNANAEVDTDEKTVAAAHFDSEQIQAGQNRLVELRQNVVTQARMENYELARMETGRLLHTLQDFYSHSNWIENGNRSPYLVLGRPNENPAPTAGRNVRTCTDCEPDRDISLFSSSQRQFFPYDCQDNLVTSSLTTGYSDSQRDENGDIIDKPTGKCSHGGIFDSSSDEDANGGINKDAPLIAWSPHFYLFEEAAAVAQQATADLLQEIRRDLNNDQLFSTYFGLDVSQDVSIAYVIDTTNSMSQELLEIQAMIPTIRTNLQQYAEQVGGDVQVRYILVPFNDPDPGSTFETKDIDEFLARIATLSANGGGDLPDPSIGAIIRAVEASKSGSPVFVFTDAPASDEHRINEAKSLIIRKNVRVSFAFVNSAITKRSLDKRRVYHHRLHFRRQASSVGIYEQLAALSGGQFLSVRTSEISELATLVTFSALQNRRTIIQKPSVPPSIVEHSFPVDSSLLNVTISVNGQNLIGIAISTPQGQDPSTLEQYSTSLVSDTSYIAHITVTDDSVQGEWTVMVQSEGSYTIQVFGSSELHFSEDLLMADSSSLSGFRDVDGKPSKGDTLAAEIEARGSSITLTELSLTGSDGLNILSVNDVTRLRDNEYVGVFVPPSGPFLLKVVGRDENGFNFSHVRDTAVELSSINLSLGEGTSGFVIMTAGEQRTVTIVMLNQGEASEFALTVNTIVAGAADDEDFFTYTLTPATAFQLGQGSTREIKIDITISDDITDGEEVTFTVIAESTSDIDISDFIAFTVCASTNPQIQSGAMLTSPLILMELTMLIGHLLLY